uniref:BPTI/Kunitz inhibitor domain-containing protein n=1 Tax=Scophthalmus maximus TaxID=52904 RepID=A0A8D3EDE6_SCOMX
QKTSIQPFSTIKDKIFRCSQILDPGPCRDYVVKWYYDATANSCAQFWFGGCLGNSNQFETERSCREACFRV